MSDAVMDDPHSTYFERLRDRQQAAGRDASLDRRISQARGIVFLVGLAMACLVFSRWSMSGWWLLFPATIFLLLVFFHARVISRLSRARAAVKYYQISRNRLDNRWIDHGATGERYSDPAHMYAGDLDIFGQGSLFQLLCRARTRLGEDTLANWLSKPATPQTIRVRHAAIEELRRKLDLREEAALLDAEVHDDLDQNRLIGWSQQPPQTISRKHRVAAILLPLAAVPGLIGWAFFKTGPSGFVIVLILEVLFTFSHRAQIRQVAATVNEAGSGLAILSQVLSLIERERFTSRRLDEIRAALDTGGRSPSRRIKQLHGLIGHLNNSLQNQFFAPIGLIFCLPIHLVHAIEMWRVRVGRHIPEWLEAVGEFEALSALAGHAYEHPNDPFPEILETGPCFEGEGLGHPLLPEQACVRNDLAIGRDVHLVLVSGSNMSGKSTLLRTVGTNLVLALAGAPVRAKRLCVSPMQLASAMRIHDSLQDGKSLFYAAISRLKSIVELTDRELPLLFLLDEILQGTNSHDRRVGAEGVIRKLVKSGALGLVTTHDLALTEIVGTLDSQAINVHFEDQLVDGKMAFDYRLHPGVVQKSNALELMRMMGLDLAPPSP